MEAPQYMTYEEAVIHISDLMASLTQLNGTLSFIQTIMFTSLCLLLGIGMFILFYNFLKNFI